MKLFFIYLIIAFGVVLLELSLFPNLTVFNMSPNILVIASVLFLTISDYWRRAAIQRVAFIFRLGLVADLLSTGRFLSITLSLITICAVFLVIRRLLNFDPKSIFIGPMVIALSVIFAVIYQLLNKIYIFNSYFWLISFGSGVLTALFFVAVYLIWGRLFKERQRLVIN